MPTTAYTDGSFIYPSQHGARQVSLPLAQDQEYYATETNRTMMQLQQFWEPAMYERTSYRNALTYSDEIDNDAWTKTNTIIFGTTTDPEGDNSAAFINETTTNAAHGVSQSIAGTGVVSFGVFLKRQTRNFARLTINNATDGDLAQAVFDLLGGTIASGTGRISRLPGGWFWCIVTGTASVTPSTVKIEIGSTASTFTYAGTVGVGIYAWRATAVFASSTSPTPVTTAATPAIYTEGFARTVTVPIVDWDDPLSFLVSESPPEQSTLELGVSQWVRGFARVSKETNVPSSIVVSKPAPIGSGQYIMGESVFFHQPEPTINTYDLYSVTDVDFDYGTPSFTLSAGTYTLTVGSYTTTSLSYSATSGDVQSALNALPSVVSAGLATVSGSATVGLGFTVVFGASATYGDFSAQLSALQPPKTLVVQNGSGQVVIDSQPYRVYETVGIGSNFGVPITGGTYTLTYEGQTTGSLDFDATKDEIGVALNALSTIQDIGGITMYDGPAGPSGLDPQDGEIKIAFYFSTPTITGDVSQLEPAPATLVVTLEPNLYGRTQYVFIAAGNNYRYLTAASHGIVNGDTIFLAGSYVSATSPATAYSSTFYVPVTNFQITDENNIRLRGTPLDEYMVAATISQVGRQVFSEYSPGQQNVRCEKITNYYLPGFTYGINTSADIPVPTAQDDGQPFFDAMIAAGDINYSVGDLAVWRGPILYQQTIRVSSQDLATWNDGTQTGSGSIEFQKSQSAVNGAIIDTSALPPLGDFTVEYWAKILSSPSPTNFGRIIDGNLTAFASFVINYRSSGPGTALELSLSSQLATNTAAMVLDEWAHWAFVRSGSAVRIYKNGALIRSGTLVSTTITMTSQDLAIGSIGGEACAGRLSDLRLWNVARSDDQIFDNYTTRIDPESEGLIAYYKLNEPNAVFADATGLAPTSLNNQACTWSEDEPPLT